MAAIIKNDMTSYLRSALTDFDKILYADAKWHAHYDGHAILHESKEGVKSQYGGRPFTENQRRIKVSHRNLA